jgi:hypothetical protein
MFTGTLQNIAIGSKANKQANCALAINESRRF